MDSRRLEKAVNVTIRRQRYTDKQSGRVGPTGRGEIQREFDGSQVK
jgi:hypothetical protein